MKCFHCDKEFIETDRKYMLGLDIPYVNLWFHLGCWYDIRGELDDFLETNNEKVYLMYNESLKTKKK